MTDIEGYRNLRENEGSPASWLVIGDAEEREMNLFLLIVEDDSEAIGIICNLVAKKIPEMRVYLAQDGKKGLELFKEHLPQIVIADINMPEMSGVEMAREMRTIKGDTKFIVVTGYSDREPEFGEIDIVDYIVKPVNFKRLLSAINSCIEQIELEKEVDD